MLERDIVTATEIKEAVAYWRLIRKGQFTKPEEVVLWCSNLGEVWAEVEVSHEDN